MWIISLASISGFIAVAMGAITDHALKNSLSAESIASIQTALDYQFVHSLALLAVGFLYMQKQWPYAKATALAFIVGVFCFCGGIYAYAITQCKMIAFIVPVGGLSFMAGWLLLFIASITFKTE